MRVLIVDDEATLRRNLADYVSTLMPLYEVATSATAEEALDLMQKEPTPDVLMTDIRLPGMDGIELVQQAMQQHPSLRVMVMTAFASDELRHDARRSGAIRFFEKPLDLDDVGRSLDELAATQSGWSAAVHDLDVFDLTQLFLLSRRRRAVRVQAGDDTGVLSFENGALVHASTSNESGEAAFHAIVSWQAGRFVDDDGIETDDLPRNISSGTTELMLEAAQLRDEASKETPQPGKSSLSETMVDELVDHSAFTCDAWATDRQGQIVAHRTGYRTTSTDAERVTEAVRQLVDGYGRRSLSSLVIQDSEGTLAVAISDEGGSVFMYAEREPSIGAVLLRLKRACRGATEG